MASQEAQPATLRIAVGSGNPVKVNAAKQAFQLAFPSAVIDTVVCKVPSGVADQPVGQAETLQGAVNRATAASAMAGEQVQTKDKGLPVTFAVGMEGGVQPGGGLELPAKAGAPPLVVDMGDPTSAPSLSCFACMAVVHVPSGAWGHATTASFPLPDPVVRLMGQGMELGDADDAVFRRSGSKQGSGAVGLLTHGLVDRTAYYVHAMLLALAPFMHPEHYGVQAVPGHRQAAPTAAEVQSASGLAAPPVAQ